MAERIVLLGGTFDPVHHGHLIVARAIAEARGLPRITLMPTGTPPHKDAARTAGRHRLEMLRLAVAGDPLFDVTDWEIRRKVRSYTIRTVRMLQAEQPGRRVTLIVGADMLADLPNWREVDELMGLADFLVAHRPGWDSRMEDVFGTLRERFGAPLAAKLREGLVETPRIDISSTEIRRRLGSGRSVRYLTPDNVIYYARENRLYQTDDACFQG
ncbi:MAG: nicotinate-nucleotide adenylyltransferase [Phycisphaerae bacterium]